MQTKELPLPVRYAGGYMYSDRQTGVLYVFGEDVQQEKALPQEVRTSKGPDDIEVREEARAALIAAPIGALYVCTRECRPEEENQSEEWAYRKVGDDEWARVED